MIDERRSLRSVALGKKINFIRMEGNFFVFHGVDNEILFKVSMEDIFDEDGNYFFETWIGGC